MVRPALVEVGGGGEVREVALETLSLWPARCLVFDSGREVVVWRGGEVGEGDERMNAARAIAKGLIEGSIPPKTLYDVKEGDSMSRWLIHRLSPSHLDPPDVQLENNVDLRSLTDSQLKDLRARAAKHKGSTRSLQMYKVMG